MQRYDFPNNIGAMHNFYCINTNNLIECPILQNPEDNEKDIYFYLVQIYSA